MNINAKSVKIGHLTGNFFNIKPDLIHKYVSVLFYFEAPLVLCSGFKAKGYLVAYALT